MATVGHSVLQPNFMSRAFYRLVARRNPGNQIEVSSLLATTILIIQAAAAPLCY